MVRPKKSEAIDIPHLAVQEAIRFLQEQETLELSLSMLSAKIGCKPPALYNHFRGKDDLFRQVRLAVFQQQIAAKKERYEGNVEDPLAALMEGGLAYLSFAEKHPALYRLLYCPGEKILSGDRDPIADNALEILSSGIENCQKAGFATGMNAAKLASFLWSAVHGAALLAMDQIDQKDASERWDIARNTVQTSIRLFKQTTSS
ncbi:MAG: TetR/AcrR family transcriptional regulator [Sneathiellales bacterium]|nr:TetR/AcrR family transcriptional regulator [Sneathiellales bacterium]